MSGEDKFIDFIIIELLRWEGLDEHVAKLEVQQNEVRESLRDLNWCSSEMSSFSWFWDDFRYLCFGQKLNGKLAAGSKGI